MGILRVSLANLFTKFNIKIDAGTLLELVIHRKYCRSVPRQHYETSPTIWTRVDRLGTNQWVLVTHASSLNSTFTVQERGTFQYTTASNTCTHIHTKIRWYFKGAYHHSNDWVLDLCQYKWVWYSLGVPVVWHCACPSE